MPRSVGSVLGFEPNRPNSLRDVMAGWDGGWDGCYTFVSAGLDNNTCYAQRKKIHEVSETTGNNKQYLGSLKKAGGRPVRVTRIRGAAGQPTALFSTHHINTPSHQYN